HNVFVHLTNFVTSFASISSNQVLNFVCTFDIHRYIYIYIYIYIFSFPSCILPFQSVDLCFIQSCICYVLIFYPPIQRSFL
ncbi:hypothetical protein K6L59_03080, partial [Candidatus Phytoplasma sp. Tabriz.2]|nr:hypothetical protein [Candidatus Phytoplasma australiense]